MFQCVPLSTLQQDFFPSYLLLIYYYLAHEYLPSFLCGYQMLGEWGWNVWDRQIEAGQLVLLQVRLSSGYYLLHSRVTIDNNSILYVQRARQFSIKK